MGMEVGDKVVEEKGFIVKEAEGPLFLFTVHFKLPL
jgi:hypothetical protein